VISSSESLVITNQEATRYTIPPTHNKTATTVIGHTSSKHLTWARPRAIPPGPKKEWGVQFCTSPKSGPQGSVAHFLVLSPFLSFEAIFEYRVYFLSSNIVVIGNRFRTTVWVTVEVSSIVFYP